MVQRQGVVMLHDTVMQTVPVPLIEYSPTVPALSNSTRVDVPLLIAVLPTVIASGSVATPVMRALAVHGNGRNERCRAKRADVRIHRGQRARATATVDKSPVSRDSCMAA